MHVLLLELLERDMSIIHHYPVNLPRISIETRCFRVPVAFDSPYVVTHGYAILRFTSSREQ